MSDKSRSELDGGRGNPILFVKNAGRGVTPPCPDAKYKPGDVVKVRNKKSLAHFPRELVVLVAVPSGFSPDYALADLVGEPRPLMCSVGKRSLSYILCEDGNQTPFIAGEKDLLPSGKPSFEIGTVSTAPTDAMLKARKESRHD